MVSTSVSHECGLGSIPECKYKQARKALILFFTLLLYFGLPCGLAGLALCVVHDLHLSIQCFS